MKNRLFLLAAAGLSFGLLVDAPSYAQTTAQVLSWNNLGMHCMDDDFSVLAILPPYNTIIAQVVVGTNGTARLVTGATGLQVSYRAVLDAENSINTTSIGKNNFWDYAFPMLGATLALDQGLELEGASPAAWMPGPANTPKAMQYESASGWFVAWGIPITPYDDTLQLNPYPLMHVAASGGGVPSVSTDIVLPVSLEINCRLCHASGAGVAARPSPDWEWDASPAKDYRFNILRLHDQIRFQTLPTLYTNVLAIKGYPAQGLYISAKLGKPVLCASCHASEAVPHSGLPGLVKPLTQAVHGQHASVTDPVNGQLLGTVLNRSACYRCHPGAETRCLRGAMGRAVASDGALAIQCQDCHGRMATVASTNRVGWLNEPNCQACHTGDALSNNGQIRYDNALVGNDQLREAVNRRFATNTNTPLPGTSLFRFSKGHGGLYCSACHGSTHAEFPSAFFNDNVASQQRQGHVGQISECSACHGTNPNTVSGGPHGMHPLNWVNGHKTPGKTLNNCRTCHNTNDRGTVLSRSFKDQTLMGQTFWRGRRIGCYECHNGPVETGQNRPAAPTANSRTASTTVNQPVEIGLTASAPILRIVSQPNRGMVGLNGNTATYYPAAGFFGTETFTFCSDNGTRESNLATVTVTVNDSGPCAYTLSSILEFFDERSHVSSVQVTTGPGCSWLAYSETLWLSILSYGGSGSGVLHYAVERNTNSLARMGSLWVAGKTVSVYQDGAPADTNGDGLSDAWQMLYFMSPDSPDAEPALDYDLDGMSNLQEYLTSTDPTDPDSVLRITAFNVYEANHAFQLVFPSLVQHYYQIQRTPDLLKPDWKGFTNAVFGTGALLPTIGPVSTNEPSMFYRVFQVN
jgi:hypothetical protein